MDEAEPEDNTKHRQLVILLPCGVVAVCYLHLRHMCESAACRGPQYKYLPESFLVTDLNDGSTFRRARAWWASLARRQISHPSSSPRRLERHHSTQVHPSSFTLDAAQAASTFASDSPESVKHQARVV